MRKLLIASSNPSKCIEIASLLNKLPIEIVKPQDLSLYLEVEENGSSYLENARIKALAYCRASHLPVLADDTGLEVEVLGGRPGLYSARFSSDPTAQDHDRRQLLLKQLKPFPRPWNARFVCCAVWAHPNGEYQHAIGTCSGEIISHEQGLAGFGYDAIFFFPEIGKTMAELTLEEKNSISHRAKAIRVIISFVEPFYSDAAGAV